MKYAIHITDMTAGELATVAAFLESIGAHPATATGPKGRQTIAELAAATGAVPAQSQAAAPTLPTPVTPPPAATLPPAGALPPAGDPFAAPAPTPAPPPGAPAPQTPATGEVDSKGLPYNPEFHTETKRRNNDGSWAKRKGVNKEACAAWEAQFAGRPAAPQIPAAPASAVPTAEQINQMHGVTTPPNGHTVVPPSTVASVPSAPPVSVAPPAGDPFAAPTPSAPPAPPAPMPAAPVEPVTYTEWYTMYSNLVASGKMSPDAYSKIAERYGAVDNAMVFMQNDDARARCFAEFKAIAAAA